MPAGFLTPKRLSIGALCLLSLIVCCGLAWWQWGRFESASGTFQNLGYVLQWPLFGLFPAFMVLRIRKLRQEAAAQDAAARDGAAQEVAQPEPVKAPEPKLPKPRAPKPVLRVHEGEDELDAYNRYLAELNARDQQDR
ncbi:hypothetical protein FPZ12_022685 [Amycolatopsis acidicola]|uniref:Uncharacterized protein n=1 Tax=Amycolatopsis acidicola TaxID=2596893 RepID=A0A5N0V160_9PSEU|nr:hypothetical protein [Amycolatopsis acidicola]KAA9158401.1 hypothetical protein FPZ12_022685 [Amycolatopsis acidicola]